MNMPFTTVLRSAGEAAATEHRDVESVGLRMPDGIEISAWLDADRGVLVLEVEGDPQAPPFHEFEIRPGAANLFSVKAHRRPRRQ